MRGSKRGELKKTLFSRRSHVVNCNAINRAVGLVVMRRLGSILNSNHCVTLESGCLVSSWKSDVDLRKEVWPEVAINILAGINIDDKWACADIVWWTKWNKRRLPRVINILGIGRGHRTCIGHWEGVKNSKKNSAIEAKGRGSRRE